MIAEAIRRGDWEEAKRLLQTELAERESARALEQLGLVGWWLDDAALTFDSRERAYQLYRDQNDPRGAARVALWLVWDFLAFRGDTAVASGWLERARRLLGGHERTAEFGWLLLREGEVALFRGHDPAAAIKLAIRAAQLGRSTGDTGLEFTGVALEGLALVSSGDVAGGMRRLDEATAAATAGEVKEALTVGIVCCWQISACERVRDYDRAAQWCERVLEFTRRWHIRPLSAVCRASYAGVLIWRGAWAEAESELMAATKELERARPAMVVQTLARLGELRMRQGRIDEAEALFEQAAGQPIARLGRAALALDRGKPEDAIAELTRFLGQVGDKEATVRAGALELLVRAHASAGDQRAAARALKELRTIAQSLGTEPLAASAAAAEGALLRASGDTAGAIDCLERAVSLYQSSGAPYEAARTRTDLAELQAAAGQRQAAERLARQASDAFRKLGAAGEEARAKRVLKPSGPASPQPITGRQLEILRLVAKGMSNTEIARRLKLSDHTVKRHVANVLTKLRLPSRAAAVAFAAQQGLL